MGVAYDDLGVAFAFGGLDGGQVAWTGGDWAFEECGGGTFDAEIRGRGAEGGTRSLIMNREWEEERSLRYCFRSASCEVDEDEKEEGVERNKECEHFDGFLQGYRQSSSTNSEILITESISILSSSQVMKVTSRKE